MNDEKLYIPVAIRKKKEIAEGIGWLELIKIGILSAIGLVLGIVLFVTTGAKTEQIYVLILPPCLGFMFGFIFLKKDITNKNSVDRILEWIAFNKSQKQYRYRYHNIWEESVHEKGRKKQEESKNTDSK